MSRLPFSLQLQAAPWVQQARHKFSVQSPQPPKNVKAKIPVPLSELVGDLFSARDSLAHCVNKFLNDLKYGKRHRGSVQFSNGSDRWKLYTGMQHGSIGHTVYVRIPAVDTTRCAFYLITKERYYQKPTSELEALKLSRFTMATCYLHHSPVSMSRIGCGMDRLESFGCDARASA